MLVISSCSPREPAVRPAGRIGAESSDEISQLARNFNQITSRLQQTIDTLESSRQQIQALLSQVCSSIGTA